MILLFQYGLGHWFEKNFEDYYTVPRRNNYRLLNYNIIVHTSLRPNVNYGGAHGFNLLFKMTICTLCNYNNNL